MSYLFEIGFEVRFGVHDPHSNSRQNVRWSHKTRVRHFVAKGVCFFDRCELLPLRLINTIGITHAGELEAILSTINHFW